MKSKITKLALKTNKSKKRLTKTKKFRKTKKLLKTKRNNKNKSKKRYNLKGGVFTLEEINQRLINEKVDENTRELFDQIMNGKKKVEIKGGEIVKNLTDEEIKTYLDIFNRRIISIRDLPDEQRMRHVNIITANNPNDFGKLPASKGIPVQVPTKLSENKYIPLGQQSPRSNKIYNSRNANTYLEIGAKPNEGQYIELGSGETVAEETVKNFVKDASKKNPPPRPTSPKPIFNKEELVNGILRGLNRDSSRPNQDVVEKILSNMQQTELDSLYEVLVIHPAKRPLPLTPFSVTSVVDARKAAQKWRRSIPTRSNVLYDPLTIQYTASGNSGVDDPTYEEINANNPNRQNPVYAMINNGYNRLNIKNQPPPLPSRPPPKINRGYSQRSSNSGHGNNTIYDAATLPDEESPYAEKTTIKYKNARNAESPYEDSTTLEYKQGHNEAAAKAAKQHTYASITNLENTGSVYSQAGRQNHPGNPVYYTAQNPSPYYLAGQDPSMYHLASRDRPELAYARASQEDKLRQYNLAAASPNIYNRVLNENFPYGKTGRKPGAEPEYGRTGGPQPESPYGRTGGPQPEYPYGRTGKSQYESPYGRTGRSQSESPYGRTGRSQSESSYGQTGRQPARPSPYGQPGRKPDEESTYGQTGGPQPESLYGRTGRKSDTVRRVKVAEAPTNQRSNTTGQQVRLSSGEVESNKPVTGNKELTPSLQPVFTQTSSSSKTLPPERRQLVLNAVGKLGLQNNALTEEAKRRAVEQEQKRRL